MSEQNKGTGGWLLLHWPGTPPGGTEKKQKGGEGHMSGTPPGKTEKGGGGGGGGKFVNEKKRGRGGRGGSFLLH